MCSCVDVRKRYVERMLGTIKGGEGVVKECILVCPKCGERERYTDVEIKERRSHQ